MCIGDESQKKDGLTWVISRYSPDGEFFYLVSLSLSRICALFLCQQHNSDNFLSRDDNRRLPHFKHSKILFNLHALAKSRGKERNSKIQWKRREEKFTIDHSAPFKAGNVRTYVRRFFRSHIWGGVAATKRLEVKQALQNKVGLKRRGMLYNIRTHSTLRQLRRATERWTMCGEEGGENVWCSMCMAGGGGVDGRRGWALYLGWVEWRQILRQGERGRLASINWKSGHHHQIQKSFKRENFINKRFIW